MAVATRLIDYEHAGTALEGFLAYDDAATGPRPAVMIAHAWAGRSPGEEDYARKLAESGYAAVAIDLYGKGVLGKSVEENQKLMNPFVEDRAFLQARLAHVVDVVKGLDEVDAGKLVAMGFCFGGLCVLDMARAGHDVRGVASFHGLFNPPENLSPEKIAPKVIAFHGYDDPMVKAEDMVGFCDEFTRAGADWRLYAYGGSKHAFMNPEANNPDFGTVYNPVTAERAWGAFLQFVDECAA